MQRRCLILRAACFVVCLGGCGRAVVGANPAVTDVADVVSVDAFDADVPDRADGDLDAAEAALDRPEVTDAADEADASDATDASDAADGADVTDARDAADVTDARDAADVIVCPSGERACEGRCVDSQWDVTHCGACGAPCSSGLACSLGRCQDGCDAPRSRCAIGGLPRCVDALRDPANCGECGRACGVGQSCEGGRCVCPVGRIQCGARCVDVQEDPGSCGGCGVVCPAVLNGRAVCVRGACGFACSEGFHRCGSACVDDRSITSCGTLCTACLPVANGVPTCDGRVCGSMCATGFHSCAGVCVTNSSLATCGMSCTPCIAPMGATASCDGRACVIVCASGFHACDGACVSNLLVTSCGASCVPCAAVMGATATCVSGACGFTCSAGLGNCDGNAANGCETDLRVSASHCGTCNRPCAAVAGAMTTCVSSACGFVCNAGVADCDRNPANGCEADTRSSPTNCGACARACASGEVCSSGVCRVPRTGWSKRFGDVSDDGVHAVASTAAGDSVVVGRMRGPTRLGTTTVAGAGGPDAIVVGLQPDGMIRWARSFGGATADAAYGVALDAAGNAFVVGTFTGRADLGRSVMSAGDSDAFVVSVAPDGTPRWARTFGAAGADTAYGVSVNATGVYVTGSVRNAVDFGGGSVAGTASPDPYVLALAPDGAFRWVRRFGAVSPRTGSGSGYGVAVGPDGGVVAVGYFQGAPTFGGDVLSSAGNFDIFIVSLASTGAQRWSRRVGAGSVDWAQAVAIDAMNNVYLTGYYQGAVDFGGGVLTAPSGTDAFLASYTVTNGHRWTRRFGGASGVFGTATGYGVAVDSGGNVAVGGTFNGNVDFGGGFRASAGGGDVFLASLTNAGAHRWSRRMGGDGDDELRGLSADGAGNLYGGGAFESTVDFGLGALASQGLTDAFEVQFVQ